MPEYIGLDFETYGAEDLPTHGLDRYAGHETFQPLIGSIALRDSRRVIGKSTFDFVSDRRGSKRYLEDAIGSRLVCAHNAGFEQRVLDHIGISLPSSRFIDSAVVARAAGAAGRLEAAAPQLLGGNKMPEGRDLIKLFSIPGKYQERDNTRHFVGDVIADHPDEWLLFVEYCEMDAALSLELVEIFIHWLTSTEMQYQALTMDMNRTGWCVDIPMVEEMQRRYLENQDAALASFRKHYDPAGDLNFNSLKQLKEWTAARGVKCVSFDEKHVEQYLTAVQRKLEALTLGDPKLDGYFEVRDLLVTKQTLGGSSLKKLKVILDTVGADGRLRDQYLHIGAGQSWRTTGRSVQMQNLKRLGSEITDLSVLEDPDVEWDNTELARNLRQCFTATDPNGRLLVGDFSAVEARGLAWLAEEDWKLDAFRNGQDLYKVAAARQFNVGYTAVSKDQRMFGKVGELSCGYQAGGGAVQSFAAGMGVELTEGEATKLVADWRAANPNIVTLWNSLDDMLRLVLEHGQSQQHYLPDGMTLRLEPELTPASLRDQHPGAQSIQLTVLDRNGEYFLKRYFHGCYVRGNSICYYKPSDRKTGDLWRSHFVDPKTKQVRFYSIYGGKLAGILTQSFCRELFFRTLSQAALWSAHHQGQTALVGQFHDEIVVDWKPGALALVDAKRQLANIMSDPGIVTSFPLAAEVKDDYRYTK